MLNLLRATCCALLNREETGCFDSYIPDYIRKFPKLTFLRIDPSWGPWYFSGDCRS
jgi:hypothetical protein